MEAIKNNWKYDKKNNAAINFTIVSQNIPQQIKTACGSTV